ncbi:GpE family phage tail protein, partial [Kingella kingae]|uniref:GpE family phage tail protein n=1 Tax=Kingella kingae TaxID=504 RepID=UPI00254F4142
MWKPFKPHFVAKKTSNPKSSQQLNQELLAACADMAWWFGWSVQEIYDLPLDEF